MIRDHKTVSIADQIFEQLEQSYISGITFSGGDPLHSAPCLPQTKQRKITKITIMNEA